MTTIASQQQPVVAKSDGAVNLPNEQVKEDLQLDVLAVAASIHQLCQESLNESIAARGNSNTSKGARLPAIIKGAMEAFSQAIVTIPLPRHSKMMLQQVKQLLVLASRLCNPKKQKHPLILLLEVPAQLIKLQTVFHSIGNLVSGILDNTTDAASISAVLGFLQSWEVHDTLLRQLLQDATRNKEELRLTLLEYKESGGDSRNGHPLLQAQLTKNEKQQLVRILEKKQTWHRSNAQNQAKDIKSRQSSQREGLLLDMLLQRMHRQDQELETTSIHLLEAASLHSPGSMHDSSLHESSLHAAALAGMQHEDVVWPEWALCPVSKSLLVDPVTVRADCAHTLSKTVFQAWIQQGKTTCPVCGGPLKALMAKTNVPLQEKVAEVMKKEARSQSFPVNYFSNPVNNGTTVLGSSHQAKPATTTANLHICSTGGTMVVEGTTGPKTKPGAQGRVHTPPPLTMRRASASRTHIEKLAAARSSSQLTDVPASTGITSHSGGSTGAASITLSDGSGAAAGKLTYVEMLESMNATKPRGVDVKGSSHTSGSARSKDVIVHVPIDGTDPLNESVLTFAEFTPSNSCSSLHVPSLGESTHSKKSNSKDSAEPSCPHTFDPAMDSSSSSAVRFTPEVVTGYMEPSPHQYSYESTSPPKRHLAPPGRYTKAPRKPKNSNKVVSTYPMIDRSKQQSQKDKKSKKGAVSKMIHYIRNPTSKSSSTTKKAELTMASTKITVQKQTLDASSKTAITDASDRADATSMSSSQHRPAPTKSILKTGSYPTPPVSPKTKSKKTRKQRRTAQLPPPLMPMATAS